MNEPGPSAPSAATAEACSTWWHVRLRVEGRGCCHLEKVCAADARQASQAAMANAADKWRGCTFTVADLLQEGL